MINFELLTRVRVDDDKLIDSVVQLFVLLQNARPVHFWTKSQCNIFHCYLYNYYYTPLICTVKINFEMFYYFNAQSLTAHETSDVKKKK